MLITGWCSSSPTVAATPICVRAIALLFSGPNFVHFRRGKIGEPLQCALILLKQQPTQIRRTKNWYNLLYICNKFACVSLRQFNFGSWIDCHEKTENQCNLYKRSAKTKKKEISIKQQQQQSEQWSENIIAPKWIFVCSVFIWNTQDVQCVCHVSNE